MEHCADMNTLFSSTQLIKSLIKQFSQEQTSIFVCNEPSELKHIMCNDLQPLILEISFDSDTHQLYSHLQESSFLSVLIKVLCQVIAYVNTFLV